jgi:uncharacterized protein YbjT (DUF2867 family)
MRPKRIGRIRQRAEDEKRRSVVKNEQAKTRIVVIGGTGLIGSKVIAGLKEDGFDAVAASPETGVNTLTGEGLAEVLEGASVVVDVSNSPSFEDAAVMEFFTKSTSNLLKYEAEAGVKHHIALSVVGAERMPEVGYYRAKVAQEKLIKESSIPYTIVHATQFFEFTKGIADSATDGDTVRLPPILIQPIAADEVAKAVVEAAEGSPLNRTVEVGGPEVLGLVAFVREGLDARDDKRKVVTDPDARFFGAVLAEKALLPGEGARLSDRRFEDWIVGQGGGNSERTAKPVGAAAR